MWADNVRLFNFARHLRSLYKDGNLSEEKINKLNAINFIWDVDSYRWNEMYNVYCEYAKNLNLSKPNTKQSSKLKNWLTVQKKRYDKGTLTSEQINKLKSVGAGFLKSTDPWIERYNDYIETLKTPAKERPRYFYQWAYKQRKLYREGLLTQEQINMLNKINFSWENTDEKWNSYFEKLVSYKKKYGTCRVVEKNVDDKLFFSWYMSLKTNFDNLSKEKQDMLLDLGYIRYIKDHIWIDKVKRYSEISHKKFSELNEEELKAYRWALTQRVKYKKGALPDKKIADLKKLNII